MNCYQEPCPPGKNCCVCGSRPGHRPWDRNSCGCGKNPVQPIMPPASLRETLFAPAVPAESMEGGTMHEKPHVSGGISAARQPAVGSSFTDFSRFPIAMGYVPVQQWQQPYPLEEGFVRGTIFPELDLPFKMGRCM